MEGSPLLQLACASLKQKALDWEGNSRRILEALAAAPAAPDIILFPELCLSGYSCEDAFFSPQLWQDAIESALMIAKKAEKTCPASVLIVGLPFYFQGKLYNCSAVLAKGRILAIVPKSVLAQDKTHYEARFFSPYPAGHHSVHSVSLAGQETVFGLMAFSYKGARFIIENCRDAWSLRRPAFSLWESNFDLILNPTASHFAFDKYILRRQIALESSRSLGVHFLMCNLLGCEGGAMLYDAHMLLASDGLLLAERLHFSFHDFVYMNCSIDLGPNRTKRLFIEPPLKNNFRCEESRLANVFVLEIPRSQEKEEEKAPLLSTSHAPVSLDHLKPRSYSHYEQFLRSVSMGLFDYLSRSKSKGFVLSLSGGIDSSACAVLVHRMLGYSIAELGLEKTLEALGRSELLPKAQSLQEKHKKASQRSYIQAALSTFMPHFLISIYQAAQYSTRESSTSAKLLAEALHASHTEVNIQEQVKQYVEMGKAILKEMPLMGTELRAKPAFKVALQNIQARSRAPLAWLLANATESLLLCTSNSSEALLGYSTMDGDTAGGLAPLAGISKAFLIEWLRFMEKQGDPLLGPIPALSYANALRPSAELQPGQLDEEELMPYPLLEEIGMLALRDHKSPREILTICTHKHRGHYTKTTLESYITRFFKLFGQSQWKRERYAPSFYLGDGNPSPRFASRFPIFNAWADGAIKL